MVLYPFVASLTLDASSGNVVGGATGSVFAKADTTFTTPLAAVDASGNPVTLTSNTNGVLPSFYVDGHTSVNWVSGSWVFPLVTSEPVEGPEGPAGVSVNGATATGDDLVFSLSNGATTPPVKLPTAPGGSDAGVASYITTPGTETATALSATTASAIETADNPVNVAVASVVANASPVTLPETGKLLAKLNRGQSDAVITILGDSTGQGDFTTSKRWPLLFAEKLAPLYPAYTVRFHMWNSTTVGYDAPVSLQTGTTARVLNIYNGSASGTTTAYSLTNLTVMSPATPDVVIISHGHNHPLLNFRLDYMTLVRELRKRYPTTAFVLTSQNPRTKASTEYADQSKIREIIAEIVARETGGLIDITTAFEAYGDYETDLMADDRHPTPAGYDLWATEFLRRFMPNKAAPVSGHRPKDDTRWYPYTMFDPAEGSPTKSTAPSAKPLSGWAFDSAAAESVITTVEIPRDWKSCDFFIFWTTHVDPGGLGPGSVMWTTYVYPEIQQSVEPSATFPLANSTITPTTVSVARGTESVAASGEALMLRRVAYPAGGTHEYTRRGVHGLRINRFANSGSDTLPIDAIFLGALYVRTE